MDLINERNNVHSWLCANKLSLNTDKSNFIIFHPPQKKIPPNFDLSIDDRKLKQEYCIKYLGIFIDSNLNWKSQVNHIITKKVERSVGVLSKLRYYVSKQTLVNLYYALIYPFLIYGIITFGNTYPTALQHYIFHKRKLCVS